MYQSNCLQLELLIDYDLLNPFCFVALLSLDFSAIEVFYIVFILYTGEALYKFLLLFSLFPATNYVCVCVHVLQTMCVCVHVLQTMCVCVHVLQTMCVCAYMYYKLCVCAYMYYKLCVCACMHAFYKYLTNSIEFYRFLYVFVNSAFHCLQETKFHTQSHD